MENCAHSIGKKSKFIEEFNFFECTILWKFNGKLSTLDVQQDQIREEKKKKNIDFVECTKSQKFKGKLSALDEQNFRIHGEFQIH